MDRTLSQFHGSQIHVLSFFHGVGIFLLTFCISMALGVIFGLSCSLMLKHSELGGSSLLLTVLFFLRHWSGISSGECGRVILERRES